MSTKITNEMLSPYGNEVAAACPDYADCGSRDICTRETNGTTAVESVLYCNNCGTITPHTCPTVANCEACALLIRAGEDTWETLGWDELVEFRTALEENYANNAALSEAERARYTAICNELVARSRENG